MFKKDWRKEFDAVQAKINDQVEKLQSEVEASQQEIEKIEAERTAALADLKFDSIQTADEKIQSLKVAIEQKQRIVEELSPEKSVALQRAAEKGLDEIYKQLEEKRADASKLENQIVLKIEELIKLINDGRKMNLEADSITGQTIQLLKVSHKENQKKYNALFFEPFTNRPLSVFSINKYASLSGKLENYK